MGLDRPNAVKGFFLANPSSLFASLFQSASLPFRLTFSGVILFSIPVELAIGPPVQR